jgi:cold shock CspA family protein
MSNSGRIQNYNKETGTGFVRADEGGELLPFSKADMHKQGEAPWEKQAVRYEVEKDSQGEAKAIKLEKA